MYKIFTLVVLTVLGFSFGSLYAATPSDTTPSAQSQKDKVPNSTSNGNYLEPQPDENGATSQGRADKHQLKESRPNNMEKSKRLTEPPESGGTKVN